MRAIVLAAGRGRRMAGLTDDRPKCLLPFRGRPLLAWQLEAISAAGVDEVAIVTGYRREDLAPYASCEFHNPRWAHTNMVRSLQTASPWLQRGPCLVCYADLFYQAEGVRDLANTAGELAISYDPDWLKLWSMRFDDPLSDAETFRIADDGALQEIGGRPEHVDDVQGQYMGLLKIEPPAWAEMQRLISRLPQGEADSLQMTHLLQAVVQSKTVKIALARYRGVWAEFDSPTDFTHILKNFTGKTESPAPIPPLTEDDYKSHPPERVE